MNREPTTSHVSINILILIRFIIREFKMRQTAHDENVCSSNHLFPNPFGKLELLPRPSIKYNNILLYETKMHKYIGTSFFHGFVNKCSKLKILMIFLVVRVVCMCRWLSSCNPADKLTYTK